jgi:hypothetical protein
MKERRDELNILKENLSLCGRMVTKFFVRKWGTRILNWFIWLKIGLNSTSVITLLWTFRCHKRSETFFTYCFSTATVATRTRFNVTCICTLPVLFISDLGSEHIIQMDLSRQSLIVYFSRSSSKQKCVTQHSENNDACCRLCILFSETLSLPPVIVISYLWILSRIYPSYQGILICEQLASR